MVSYNLNIVDIRNETVDTKTLCLKQPGLKKVKYSSGQYLTLVFRINGRKYIRPYSFSSAPNVDQHLEVTVKRVPGGVVSNHINDFVKIGDNIEVIPPMGDFVFDIEKDDKKKHVILWGAGSGITPLISIAKHILYKASGNKVWLVYGNRTHDSVIFKDKIAELENLFPDTFKVWNFYTELKISENNELVIQGRISPEKMHAIMKQEPDLQNTVHYICGPSGLKDSVRQSLKTMSINDNAIFCEEFEIVKNPEDFKDITTRVVEIVKDGNITKVEVIRGKSILESALDALLDLDYSCQTGSCMLCKAKVLSGDVKIIGVEEPPQKIAPDECLLCCGYPVSDNVKLHVF